MGLNVDHFCLVLEDKGILRLDLKPDGGEIDDVNAA